MKAKTLLSAVLIVTGLLAGATTASAINHSIWQAPVSKASSKTEVSSTVGMTECENQNSATKKSSNQTTKSVRKRRVFRKK